MADIDRKREDDAPDESPSTGRGFNPWIFIAIIGGMIVAALIAFVIVFKILVAPPASDEEKDVGKEVYFGKLFSFEEAIIVNLAETQGQRYLKVSIQFEVNDEKVIEELKARTPLMLDLLINILSSKTIDDIANTVGRNRLRREIIDKSNAELVSGKIINVYFTEFVIQ